MTTNAATLMPVAMATLLLCQDKFLHYFYNYLWLWGGPH